MSRIICFSEIQLPDHDEIRLWSHYAVKHKGIRIRFCINESKYPLKEVTYSDNPIDPDLASRWVQKSDQTEKQLKKQLELSTTTKAKGWSYEKEWRMLLDPAACSDEPDDDGNRISCFKFDPAWVKGIDFGLNCQEKEITPIIDLVKKEYPGIELRNAVRDPDKYGLQFEPV